jgi:hypothetical protein
MWGGLCKWGSMSVNKCQVVHRAQSPWRLSWQYGSSPPTTKALPVCFGRLVHRPARAGGGTRDSGLGFLWAGAEANCQLPKTKAQSTKQASLITHHSSKSSCFM